MKLFSRPTTLLLLVAAALATIPPLDARATTIGYREVARTGTVVNGKLIDSFQVGLDSNNNGEVIFRSTFDAGSGPFSGDGVFSTTGFFAGTGTVVGGLTLDGAFSPQINDSNAIVYNGSAGATTAIFDQGAVIVQSGDIIDGNPLRAPQNPALNNNGDVVFRSRRQASFNTPFSIYTPTSGLVVLPATIGGVSLGQISGAVALSDSGEIAYRADSFSAGFGIYTETRRVMGNGTVVDGETVNPFLNPGISPTGDILFNATGTIGRGMVLDSGGVLSIVLREGDLVDGRVIDSLDNNDSPSINSNGVFVFTAESSGVRGLYTQNQLIAEVGQPLFGSTITSLSSPIINDQHQIFFRANLANSDEVLVLAQEVPEPGAATLVLLGILACRAGQRRCRR